MSKSCVYVPKKGAELFTSLKKECGYDTAKEVYHIARSKSFISKYRNTLVFNDEGIPTYDSLRKNSYIDKYIKSASLLKELNNSTENIPDTLDNYLSLWEEAYNFNTNNENRSSVVATVVSTDGGVKIHYQMANAETTQQFKNNYAAIQLNRTVLDILQDVGISIDILKEEGLIDSKYGGMIDFSKAIDNSNGLDSMITIANNSKGTLSISEEFSHLLIRLFKDSPLVERSLKLLQNEKTLLKYVSQQELEDLLSLYRDKENPIQYVTEEVLGRVLQQELLKEHIQETLNTPSNLIERLVSFIVKKFKNFRTGLAKDATIKVESFMHEIASKALNKEITINPEDLKELYDESVFYNTATIIDDEIKKLEEAKGIIEKIIEKEQKLHLISRASTTEFRANISDLLEANTSDDINKVYFTIAKYAINMSKDLAGALNHLNSALSRDKIDANMLVSVRRHLYAYHDITTQIQELLSSSKEFSSIKPSDVDDTSKKKTIKGVIDAIAASESNIAAIFKNLSMQVFARDLAPLVEGQYTEEDIMEMLKTPTKDIAWIDKFLLPFSTSKNDLLQIVAFKIATAKHAISQKTISSIRGIATLMKEAEETGIKNWNFIYEVDENGKKTGYLVDKYDRRKRQQEYAEYKKSLFEQYDNPITRAKEIRTALKEWEYEHPVDAYISSAYNRLSEVEKYYLEQYKNIKNAIEQVFPKSQILKNRAIQIRKNSNQRIVDAVSSGSIKEILKQAKLAFKDSIAIQIDDVEGYGVSSKTMLDMSGNEYLAVPKLYTELLEDTDQLSTDAIGALMNYAYAASFYETMSGISNVLELGKYILDDNAPIETSGNIPEIEEINYGGLKAINPKRKTTSRIADKYKHFVDSQVYMRENHAGTINAKYFKKKDGEWTTESIQLSVDKMISKLLNFTSKAQQGFNIFSQTANVIMGKCMTRIEASACAYFNYKDVLKADEIYFKDLLPGYLGELGDRVKTNKLSLINELFETQQEIDKIRNKDYRKNPMWRFFGPHWYYIGQTGGDHYLYNRILVAYCLHTKVKVPTESGDYKEVRLWDAIEVVPDAMSEGKYSKAQIIPGTLSLEGGPINIVKESEKIKKINFNLFGVYNSQDMFMARKYTIGKLLTNFRSWMSTSYDYRFGKKHYDVVLEKEVEGYYTATYKIITGFITDAIRFGVQWEAYKDTLSSEDLANINRAITEISQYGIFSLSRFMLGVGDVGNEDEDWYIKLLQYYSVRMTTELSALCPINPVAFAMENAKILRTPIPAYTPIIDLFTALGSMFTPSDYSHVLQSGPYKGYTKFEKNLLKAPILGFPIYKHISRFLDPEEAVMYYLKTY